MGAKYNFTISGNSLLMQRTPISEDTQYKAISFKSPSLVQDNNKIKLFEAGEFQTSLRFIDFGLIDGIAPTDLQDAKDKLLALIGTINESGGGNFVPLSGTTAGNPITGDLDFSINSKLIFKDLDNNPFIKIGYNPDTDETGIWYDNGVDLPLRFSILSNGIYFYIGSNSIVFSENQGIIGSTDFTPNITDLDYTQKKYVDSLFGTLTSVFFESVSKNLKSNPYVLNYTSGKLTSIVYTLPTGTITKTLNYTGDKLTSIVLSGDTPNGIQLTKTLSYTAESLTNITYS